MGRLALIPLVLGFVLATQGCRCVSGSELQAERQRRPPEQEATGVRKTGDPWVDGVLPPEILEGTPKRGGEVTIHMYTEPPSLNPIIHSDWWGAALAEHIYDALVDVDPYDDPDYRYIPGLAERWEISDDRLTYTFHLRHGVRWHDGQPFTARDVIATYAKVMDQTTKAVHVRAYMKGLEKFEALDDYTVRFQWKEPYFLAMSEPFAGVIIQPAHVIEKLSGIEYNEASTDPLMRHPIGTGPFRFVEWESNQKVVLRRNDDYWGKKPHLDRLVFRIVKELDVALQLAERGELDVVTRVLDEAWVGMDNPKLRQNFYRSKFYDANYAWIGWNELRPFFKDRRVRRALTMLVDRPGIIDKLAYGLPMPTTCHFYWKSKACDPKLEPLPYDRLAAVKLLEEAGWKDTNDDGIRDRDGVEFRFDFMLPASSVWAHRMATMMKEDFGRAGIDLAVQKVEWSAFTRRLRDKEFDACTLIWGGGPRGDPTQIWHSSSIDGGSNYISFSNPKADALMDQAKVIFDDDRRNAIYRQFSRLLYEEQPYTWLYVRPRLSLVSRRLRGVRESLMFWQYEDWWVEDPPARN